MRIALRIIALSHLAGCGAAVPAALPLPTCAPTPAPCVSHAPFDPRLVTLTLQAPVIFQGTVQRIDASTEPSTPSTPARPLFVVRVDQQLWGAELSPEVTVDSAGAATPAVGSVAFFFVRPQVYGVGIVTLEQARVAPGTFGNIVTDVPEIRRLAAERALYDELIDAQRVVMAEVQSVASEPVGFIGSEHDPVWTDSVVYVECTLRGPAAPSASVRFAASTDVSWYQSPKLTAGQRGLLLLHGANTDPQYSGTNGPNDSYAGQVVARQHDSLAPSELQHVVDLLACPPTL